MYFIPRVNKMVAERQGDDALTALFIKIGRVQYVVFQLSWEDICYTENSLL